MSSPFVALGLGEDADERAVKRAYAQRLKSARPDEDPEAFQALNGAYKAALAAIRWRAQAAEPEAADEAVGDGTPSGEAPSGETGTPLPASEPLASPLPPQQHETVLEPSAPEPASDELPYDYATPRDDGGIEFDFDAFAAALFEVAADPDADLAAWLRHEMADWPLAMKPTLAPYLLHTIEEAGIVVSPEHFATLVAAFGLDDVHAGVDPVAVELLRKANEQRWVKGEATERARRLLAPSNRHELDKAVRVGGYMPFAAPLLARLVTGPGARRRTGLRWVPLLARWVMNLLRYVSANTVDALSPPIDPKVLARWQAADRLIGKMGLGAWLGAAFGVFIFAGILQGMWEGLQEDVTHDRFTMAQQEERSAPALAVRDYTAYLAATPPPWSDDVAENVAIAYFGRGLMLARLDRIDEAMASYRKLDEIFADYTIRLVRLQVAKGLLNLAYLSLQKGDYHATIDYARKLTARYSGTDDEVLGEDGFALLVVKALNDEADAANRLGARMAGGLIAASVLDRYKDTTNAAMKDELDYTRDIKHESETGATSPSNASSQPSAPFQSSGPFQPSGAGAPPRTIRVMPEVGPPK